MGGGDSKTIEQTTTTQPNPYIQDRAFDYYEVGKDLAYDMPFTPFPYFANVNLRNFNNPVSRVYSSVIPGQPDVVGKVPDFQSLLPPIPQATQQGLELLKGRAVAGSPVLNAGQQNLMDTLQGKYLTADSNPYLSGMYDAAARQMMQNYNEAAVPQTNAMFNRAGAFGGSAHRLFQAQQARDLQQGLGDLANQMYGNQYQQERLNQLRGMLFAPEMAQSDYRDIQALLSAGDIERQFDVEKANELYNWWQQATQFPFQMHSYAGGAMGPLLGTGGGTTTGSQPNPYYVSPASQMMGGLASGAGLGTMLGMATGNPLIGAAGGLGGLLAGLF